MEQKGLNLRFMKQIQHHVGKISYILKKHETKLMPVLKFLAGMFVFIRLGALGGVGVSIGRVMALSIACSAVTMIVSPGLFLVMMGAVSCFYISMVSVEAALLSFAAFFLIFVFYVRIFPKESLLIPVMLVAYLFKIPYIVPIVAGLYFGLRSIGAVAITVFLHSSKSVLFDIMEMAPKTDFDLMGMLDNFIKIMEMLSQNINYNWIFIAGVFALSSISAWVVNNLFINHEKIVAIGVSGIVMVVGIIIVNIMFSEGASTIGAIVGTAVSCVIAYFITAFDFVLDYSKTEYVKFQDDNYMYYVKAVPKAKE